MRRQSRMRTGRAWQRSRDLGVGSALLEPILKRLFGPGCLKVAVCGFDPLYRRLNETDEVLALGLIHQKQVR